jgi:hypothetical protein
LAHLAAIRIVVARIDAAIAVPIAVLAAASRTRRRQHDHGGGRARIGVDLNIGTGRSPGIGIGQDGVALAAPLTAPPGLRDRHGDCNRCEGRQGRRSLGLLRPTKTKAACGNNHDERQNAKHPIPHISLAPLLPKLCLRPT